MASLGEAYITISASDQLPSDPVFEALNLFAERGPSDMEKLSRSSKVQMFREGNEGLELS
jgi:hypothetical protein